MPADHRPARGPSRFRLRKGSAEEAGVPWGLDRMWATVLRRFRDHIDDVALAESTYGADDTSDQHTAKDTHDHP